MTPHLYKRLRAEIDELRAEKAELIAALKEIEFHGGPAADHARAAIAKVENSR